MASITLKFKDLVLKEYAIEGGSKTIGREPGNGIILENLLVSGHHARIDQAGKDYILTDLQSKNGTLVNGERITSTKLRDGDQILIGKHTLVFSLDPSEAAAQNLAEATMFMDMTPGAAAAPQTPGTIAAPQPRKPEEDAEPTSIIAPVERAAVLSFLSGGTEDFELSKKLVKLGKGQEADIQVGGFFTPKVAATISRRATGYHLTATSGRAKVKVNGEQIKGSHRLSEFDTIEVGAARMQFYYKA
jgi:predicted component of type VI protein secretion system